MKLKLDDSTYKTITLPSANVARLKKKEIVANTLLRADRQCMMAVHSNNDPQLRLPSSPEEESSQGSNSESESQSDQSESPQAMIPFRMARSEANVQVLLDQEPSYDSSDDEIHAFPQSDEDYYVDDIGTIHFINGRRVLSDQKVAKG